jgi:hypothetical protein
VARVYGIVERDGKQIKTLYRSIDKDKRRRDMGQLKRMVLDLKYYFERSLQLILLGAALGYTFANHLEERSKPDTVGFATVEDMSFLVSELEDCRDAGGPEDSY